LNHGFCSPWDSPIYKDTIETDSVGGITWNGFISQVLYLYRFYTC
jgi:hypothetical protein